MGLDAKTIAAIDQDTARLRELAGMVHLHLAATCTHGHLCPGRAVFDQVMKMSHNDRTRLLLIALSLVGKGDRIWMGNDQ